MPAAAEPVPVIVLRDLVTDGRAVMLGAIRQEVLSGIKTAPQFDALRQALAAFDDIQLHPADFERAASFFNRCRSKGVQGSNTDFLICAAAVGRDLPILTTDGDFALYQKHLPIQLLR
jgi:predicted nucleic acid-binding protein